MARRNRPKKQRRRTPLDGDSGDRSGIIDMTHEAPEPRTGKVRTDEAVDPADVAEREDRGGPDVTSILPEAPQREFDFEESDALEILAETPVLDLLDDAEEPAGDMLYVEDQLISALQEEEEDEDEAQDEAESAVVEEEQPPERKGYEQRPIDAEFGPAYGNDDVSGGETITYLDSALEDPDPDDLARRRDEGPPQDVPVFDPDHASAEIETPETSETSDEVADEVAADEEQAAAPRTHLRLVKPGEQPEPSTPESPEAEVAFEGSEAGARADVAAESAATEDASQLLQGPHGHLDRIDELAPERSPRTEVPSEPSPDPVYPSEARRRRQRLAAQEASPPPLPEPGSLPRLASTKVRTAAFAVDAAILLLFVPGTVLIGVLAFGLDGYRAADSAEAWGHAKAAVNGLMVLAATLYFGVSQALVGATPGKQLFGIRVVRVEDGAPIGFGRALLRVAAYGLNLLTLGGGFVYALFDRKRRGLHDILARTLVAQDDR